MGVDRMKCICTQSDYEDYQGHPFNKLNPKCRVHRGYDLGYSDKQNKFIKDNIDMSLTNLTKAYNDKFTSFKTYAAIRQKVIYMRNEMLVNEFG